MWHVIGFDPPGCSSWCRSFRKGFPGDMSRAGSHRFPVSHGVPPIGRPVLFQGSPKTRSQLMRPSCASARVPAGDRPFRAGAGGGPCHANEDFSSLSDGVERRSYSCYRYGPLSQGWPRPFGRIIRWRGPRPFSAFPLFGGEGESGRMAGGALWAGCRPETSGGGCIARHILSAHTVITSRGCDPGVGAGKEKAPWGSCPYSG